MRAKVFFNDCYQNDYEKNYNTTIVNRLIDKKEYDYAIQLYFNYDFDEKPYLASFQITKLNGEEKWSVLFKQISWEKDSGIVVRDLTDRIKLYKIDDFDLTFTKDILREYCSEVLGIASTKPTPPLS